MILSPWGTLQPREATDDRTLLEEIFRLRVTAWRGQASFVRDMEAWTEAADESARHWAFLLNEKPIAAARLSLHAAGDDIPQHEVMKKDLLLQLHFPVAYYGRAVVHPDYRRQGMMAGLLRHCIEEARAAGASAILAATGSVPANRFAGGIFERRGFTRFDADSRCDGTPYQAQFPPMIFVLPLQVPTERRSAPLIMDA